MTFLQKIEENQPVNVHFMGGCLSLDKSLSDGKEYWVPSVKRFFKNEYGNKFIFNNSSSVGVGILYGLFRLSLDVLAYNPDLIFIEFSINDHKEDSHTVSICMEEVICRLKKHNPDINIIFIFMPALYNTHTLDYIYLAEHYKIPYINIEQMIWEKINNSNIQWSSLFIDECHPNLSCIKIYSNYICSALKNNNSFKTFSISKKRLFPYDFREPRIESWTYGDYSGKWVRQSKLISGRECCYIESEKVGDIAYFRFSGKCFGLIHDSYIDSGIIDIKVDDNQTQRVNLSSPTKVNIIKVRFCQIDLNDGNHIVKISIPQENKGKIGIIGIMIE